jgi:6-phosphogluconate dehydrogenase
LRATVDADEHRTRRGKHRADSYHVVESLERVGWIMVASNYTVDKLYTILRKHLTNKTINAIIIDLASVPGNKSFRDTVQRLQDLHQFNMRTRRAKLEE